jgi:hypothetical protein
MKVTTLSQQFGHGISGSTPSGCEEEDEVVILVDLVLDGEVEDDKGMEAAPSESSGGRMVGCLEWIINILVWTATVCDG